MKILSVDFSSIVRSGLKKELEGGGYSVIEASSGSEALDLFEEHDVSLITLSTSLPDMDGFEVCSRIRDMGRDSSASRQKKSSVPIVFITSDDSVEGRERGFDSGATDFIKKSYSKGELLSLVRSIVEPSTEFLGSRVLVVDDSDIVRGVVSRQLTSLGAEVVTAEDGREAYEFLKQKGNQVSLVVTDLSMPNMAGDTLCRRIRGDLGLVDLPVIFLTAHGNEHEKLRLFRCGGTDYMEKPFLKEEFIARVGVQLQKSRRLAEISSLNQELEGSNKALEEFAHVAAHDLRSPLKTVRGLVDLIDEDYEDQLVDGLRGDLQTIGEIADRMDRLIGDVLEHSRVSRSSVSSESVDLSDLISGITRDLSQPISESGAKIVVGKLPIVVGNPIQLRRLFQNLFANSLKYQPETSAPEINVSSPTLEEVPDQNCFCEIIVKDNGIGFEQKYAEKIFESFERLVGDSQHEGSGIGLSTCKNIVLQHGGSIRAESAPGEGASFIVRLPI